MLNMHERTGLVKFRKTRIRQSLHKKFRVNKLLTLFIQSASSLPVKPKLYIVGDSTSCIYESSAYRRSGWAQVMKNKLIAGGFQVCDISLSGRSSKSFYTEGHWTTVKNLLRKDDCVILQFGHNDENTDDAEITLERQDRSGKVIETLFDGRLRSGTSMVTCRPGNKGVSEVSVLRIHGKTQISCTVMSG